MVRALLVLVFLRDLPLVSCSPASGCLILITWRVVAHGPESETRPVPLPGWVPNSTLCHVQVTDPWARRFSTSGTRTVKSRVADIMELPPSLPSRP